MKVILFLVVIVATAALSFGYLGSPSINIVAQQIGIGEFNTVFDTVTDGAISIKIDRMIGATLSGSTVITDAFKDKIVECVFRSTDRTIKEGSTLICKLTDDADFEVAKIIAEGRKIITNDVGTGVPITVPINNLISTTSSDTDFIHNIFFIIQDPPS